MLPNPKSDKTDLYSKLYFKENKHNKLKKNRFLHRIILKEE